MIWLKPLPHLDVEVRGAVAVGADQDPVALCVQQLLDGSAKGERLPRPVGPEDDDGGQGELQGGGDGSHGLPLLGVEPLVHLGQLPAEPLLGRVPGYRGSAGISTGEKCEKTTFMAWEKFKLEQFYFVTTQV